MLHDQLTGASPCPCGSGKTFAQCCEPALNGTRPAPTAEALMRSRYCAFAIGAVEYLLQTIAPEKRQEGDAELLTEQTQVTTWTGLKILSTRNGTENDSLGEVSFEARFESGPSKGVLREHSRFRRDAQRWVYVDGDVELLPG
ncbi:YchJ family protein [Marinobacterium sp. YM272]|uniref:YchJ family protein n=1 Tax=Marinobacterium sp. YM272 TaxID=3421654 RepID=UPI003D7F418E